MSKSYSYLGNLDLTQIKSANVTRDLNTIHIYVATTGSDSNDGETALTPFLTIEKAFDSIPNLTGGIYQINIADGTYNLSSVIAPKQPNSSEGSTGWSSIVKIVGNSAVPANVVINALNTSSSAFRITGSNTLFDFDGINISNCSRGIEMIMASVVVRNVTVTNYVTNGILVSYMSRLFAPPSSIGLNLICDGTITFSRGILVTAVSQVLIQSPLSITGFKGSGSGAVGVLLESAFNLVNSSTILTADVAGALFGFSVTQGGQLTISSTITITNCSLTSATSQYGAFVVGSSGRLSFAGGTVNITNCNTGFNVLGIVSESASANYNYTSVTSKVRLCHAGTIDTHNSLNAVGAIVYVPSLNASPDFGYDDRYIKVFGNTLFVDAVNGNDSLATRGGGIPYLTPEAALADALSGDVVQCSPGSYNFSAGITLPTGVTLRGVSSNAVTFSMLNVTTDTDLVTMGESSRLEDCTLRLTSTEHHTLVGIIWPGTTTETAKVRRIVLQIDNSSAGDVGTSDVWGMLVNGTSTPGHEINGVRAATITVDSAGLGNKRCVYVDQDAYINIRDTNVRCTRTGAAAGSYIAEETNSANARICHQSGTIEGNPTADISQTQGEIHLTAITFVNGGANGKSFVATGIGYSLVFADSGVMPNGVTRYFRPGTANVDSVETKIRIGKKSIAYAISVRALVPPGAGKTDVYTVRKNGADTGLTVSLTDANTTATSVNLSDEFTIGDDLSVSVATDSGSGTEDVVVTVDLY